MAIREAFKRMFAGKPKRPQTYEEREFLLRQQGGRSIDPMVDAQLNARNQRYHAGGMF